MELTEFWSTVLGITLIVIHAGVLIGCTVYAIRALRWRKKR